MKAIVRTQYGPPDVLQFTEVEKPTPKDNKVLMKVYAASVNPLDLFHMEGAPLVRRVPGLRTPKQQVLGCDISGRVEAVGGHVQQFQPD
jgi:NADPH:quinone reductase-like Zn-dependent oxidoreductase